jgi:hypothetical protein
MFSSHVTVGSKIPQVKGAMLEALARALAMTGKAIADQTKATMQPGHFLETGLSQETTLYEQRTTTSGQVHIPTSYAAYPEFGTVHMAPRPVLMPAIQAKWPTSLYGYWGQAMKGLASGQQVLPATPAPGAPTPPIDPAGTTGSGRTKLGGTP